MVGAVVPAPAGRGLGDGPTTGTGALIGVDGLDTVLRGKTELLAAERATCGGGGSDIALSDLDVTLAAAATEAVPAGIDEDAARTTEAAGDVVAVEGPGVCRAAGCVNGD